MASPTPEETSNAWWVAGSSFALLAVIPVFWAKQLVRHYALQTMVILLATIFSFFHHECYEAALQMCNGQSPDATQSLDVLFAFLALVLGLAPFVECWGGGYKWRAHYEICMGFTTGLMVVLKQDGLETMIMLGVFSFLVFAWLAFVEFRRRRAQDTADAKAKARHWLWWVRYWALVVPAAGVGLTWGMSKSPLVSFQENRKWHAWWHVTGAMTYTLAATLLPRFDQLLLETNEHTRLEVYEPRGGGKASPPPPAAATPSVKTKGRYTSVHTHV